MSATLSVKLSPQLLIAHVLALQEVALGCKRLGVDPPPGLPHWTRCLWVLRTSSCFFDLLSGRCHVSGLGVVEANDPGFAGARRRFTPPPNDPASPNGRSRTPYGISTSVPPRFRSGRTHNPHPIRGLGYVTAATREFPSVVRLLTDGSICHGILAVHVFDLTHTSTYAKALWLAAAAAAPGSLLQNTPCFSPKGDHGMGSKE